MIKTSEGQSKSLYAISQHFSTTIKAYKIEGDQIIYQTDAHGVPDHDYGAIDLAIDPESYYLFVTYEGSETIEIINAKTMIGEQESVDVPGATNLAEVANEDL